MIPASKLMRGEQTFTWAGAETVGGELIHIAIDRLNAFLLGSYHPVIKADLTSLVQIVHDHVAIDETHVAKLPDDVWKYPITLLEWGNGTHIIGDGGHRIMKLQQLGFEAIAAWSVQRKLWEKFQIDGIPGDRATWEQLNRDPTRYTVPGAIIRG